MTHLDPKQFICGFPSLEIRKLLRLSLEPHLIHPHLYADRLGISKRRAEQLAADLVADGYLKDAGYRDGWLRATTLGQRIAIANGAPQIKRATADRLVADVVRRMHELQSHPVFTYRVAEAWVFGSYVTPAERLSDIDLLVRFVGLTGDLKKDIALREARSREVGRYREWRNYSEEMLWPYYEVLRFLKARSPYIEIHDSQDEEELLRLPGIRRIFPVRSQRSVRMKDGD